MEKNEYNIDVLLGWHDRFKRETKAKRIKCRLLKIGSAFVTFQMSSVAGMRKAQIIVNSFYTLKVIRKP